LGWDDDIHWIDHCGRFASSFSLEFASVLTTSARLFRVLSHLQVPGVHSGAALARELGVSARTIRSDVAALRELGYGIEAVPGVAGGYELGPGKRLPPLLLDDDEVVAIALGLTSSGALAGSDLAVASMRALSKIIAMLPARLRPRLSTLAHTTVALPARGAPVASEDLQAIASAIQRHEQLRFTYATTAAAETEREVEPYRLALRAGRWYLLAWDPLRDDWRTFRVDRMRLKMASGRRFAKREEPTEGFDAYLVRHLESATWQRRYRVRLAAPAGVIRERAPISVEVTADGPEACIVTVGSDSAAAVARYLSWWEVPFSVLDSDELKAEVRLLAERYSEAAKA
jgi:predicted DNA-binding transcriptional regulator YafY